MARRKWPTSAATRLGRVFLCAGCVGLAPQVANAAGPKQIDPIFGWAIGKGVVMNTRQVTTSTCVTVRGVPGPRGSVQAAPRFERVKNRSNVRRLLDVNIAVAGSYNGAVVEVSVDSRFRLLRDSRISEDTDTIQVTIDAPAATRMIPAPTLTDDWAKRVVQAGGVQEFRQKCGDVFVAGVQEAHMMYGFATLQNSSQSMINENGMYVYADGRVGPINFKAMTDIQDRLEKDTSSSELRVSYFTTYIPPKLAGIENVVIASNALQLEQLFNSFDPGVPATTPKKIAVVSYRELPNWPSAAAFAAAADPNEQTLEPLIDASWRIQPFIDRTVDIAEKTETPAMGRFATLKGWRAQVSASQKKLQSLQESVAGAHRACLASARESGRLSAECTALANFWKTQNVEQRLGELMPRPGVTCVYQPTRLNGQGPTPVNEPPRVPGEDGEDLYSMFDDATWVKRNARGDGQLGPKNDYLAELFLEKYDDDKVWVMLVQTLEEQHDKVDIKDHKSALEARQALKLAAGPGCFFADKEVDQSGGKDKRLEPRDLGKIDQLGAVFRQGPNNQLNPPDPRFIESVTCNISSSRPKCTLTFRSKLIPKLTYNAQYKSAERLAKAQASLAAPDLAKWTLDHEREAKRPRPMTAEERAKAASIANPASAAASASAARAAQAQRELAAREAGKAAAAASQAASAARAKAAADQAAANAAKK